MAQLTGRDALFLCNYLDGTDFPIEEPSPFNPKWFSDKFHMAGLCYEISIFL